MRLVDEKVFNYYMDNPSYIKFKIKEIKDAIKYCDYMINHLEEAYTVKLNGVEEVKNYKSYLLIELDTFKSIKRNFEKVNY